MTQDGSGSWWLVCPQLLLYSKLCSEDHRSQKFHDWKNESWISTGVNENDMFFYAAIFFQPDPSTSPQLGDFISFPRMSEKDNGHGLFAEKEVEFFFFSSS